MKLDEARSLAETLLMEFECDGWSFKFDQARRRFGRCDFRMKRIQLSAVLTRVNERSEVEDTIRHEIAHILVGPGHGHDEVWQLMCRVTGARPERCYDVDSVNKPEPPYYLVCNGCGYREPRYRRPKYDASKYKHPKCGTIGMRLEVT